MTTSVLGADETFTGPVFEVSDFASLLVTVSSDVDSAASGLVVQFGALPGTFTEQVSYTYKSSESFSKNVPVLDRYCRLVYTNGSTIQTTFTLHYQLLQNPTYLQMVPTAPMVDAVGRVRYTSPFTMIDVTHIGRKNVLKTSEFTSGTGGISYNSNTSSVSLTVSGGTDRAVIQTRKFIPYQAGKSMLLQMTGVINGNNNSSNCISRIGYFDDLNGLFFQHTGNGAAGTISVVKRNGGVNTVVPQSDWNLNRLSNVASGYVLNPSKVQLYIIDFVWQGVGVVRFGIYHRNSIIYVHEFIHDNLEDGVYIGAPNLPIRYEIVSSGGSGTLVSICSTAISEGGFSPVGYSFSHMTGGRTVSSSNVVPILVMRFKTGTSYLQRAVVVPTKISLFCSTNGNIKYTIRLQLDRSTEPITGGTYSSVHSNSCVAINDGGTAYNTDNGIDIAVKQGISTDTADIVTEDIVAGILSDICLSTTVNEFNGAVATCYLILTAQREAGGAGSETVYGIVEWKEIL